MSQAQKPRDVGNGLIEHVGGDVTGSGQAGRVIFRQAVRVQSASQQKFCDGGYSANSELVNGWSGRLWRDTSV